MKAPQLVRFHPRTGEVLEPLFVTKRGRLVWPILGASEDDDSGGADDDSGDDDAGDDDSDDDADDSDDDSDEDEGKKKSKSKKDDDDDATVPEWKYAKAMKRMQAADQRSSRLEKELAELKKQGTDAKDVDAKLREENEKLTPKVEKLTKDNNELRLQVAFLSANEINWVDPQVALKLVDLSDVDIDDETGKVDTRALKAALKDLARTKKYLVRPAAGKDEDDSDDSGASGRKMNGKRKGDKDTVDRKALAKRFPALGAR